MYKGKAVSPKSLRNYERKLVERTITHDDIAEHLTAITNAFEKFLSELKDKEDLKRLANHRNGYIRAEVAFNENTPTEILRDLAEDVSILVRTKVAENPNTPLDVLQKLAEDEKFREHVAVNQSLPLEILKKLSKDENPEVRYCVVINKNTPIELLEELAKDEEEMVSRLATTKLKRKRSE